MNECCGGVGGHSVFCSQNPNTQPLSCQHGQLARSCYICELENKVDDLEQTSMELCEKCGWRTHIPDHGCVNCSLIELISIADDACELMELNGMHQESDYQRLKNAVCKQTGQSPSK